jgi:coatomer subunit alpha
LCPGVAAGLAADEEGGEDGGWGAEADLGLDEEGGDGRDEFHDAVAEEGGEGDGWAAEDEDLDIPADLEPTPSAAAGPEGGDDGYFVAPTRLGLDIFL